MKRIKTTEGVGYISGDYECWCIHPVPFDEWKDRDLFEVRKELPDSIYPSDLFPLALDLDFEKDGFDYDRKVRYKVTVEVEHIE